MPYRATTADSQLGLSACEARGDFSMWIGTLPISFCPTTGFVQRECKFGWSARDAVAGLRSMRQVRSTAVFASLIAGMGLP